MIRCSRFENQWINQDKKLKIVYLFFPRPTSLLLRFLELGWFDTVIPCEDFRLTFAAPEDPEARGELLSPTFEGIKMTSCCSIRNGRTESIELFEDL